MANAISSGAAATVVRSGVIFQVRRRHTLEECAFCHSQSEKNPTAAVTASRGKLAGGGADAKSIGQDRSASEELTPEEKQQVEKLKARDREVHAHELAHLSAAGGHARGAPSFTYQKGPDGVMYAVGGEVPIDVSPVPANPQATLQKAEAIQRAALAPAEPSGQDRQVAARAAALALTARQELARQSQEITNTGKKFASPHSLFSAAGTSFPLPRLDTTPEFSSAQTTPYSLQKQKDSISTPGALLNIFA